MPNGLKRYLLPPDQNLLCAGVVIRMSPSVQGIAISPGYEGVTLEVLPSLNPSSHREQTQVHFQVTGMFSIEHLPEPSEVNRIPLGIYFPPVAFLRYDENGQRVFSRVLPSLRFCDSAPSPALILTTLEAARLIAGDDCISAIRVRVGGIDGLTPRPSAK